MNRYGIALLWIVLFINIHNLKALNLKASLTGKITDKNTGAPIPGAIIYIPDLKTGTVSKNDGSYLIENLPAKKILIQVSLVGYKTIVANIDLSTTTTKDFSMETSVTEINEIVVTGHSQAEEKRTIPTPISSINQTQLLQNSSTNIIDAIATQPGISQISTGAGISKPVIRGLGYNRVVVVNDGIRQEGQQWGDEHGIEIDEFSANKIEILKGPASLSYGSDAIAGVINILSAPPLPEGTIKATVLGNYQTNNGLIGYSANIAGNKKGFVWDLRYSNKIAHAYQNKYDGYVFNSGFKENAISGMLGMNKAWGYSHINFSIYEMQPGIIEGDRDSASGKFIKPVVVNDSTINEEIATSSDARKYKLFIPYQQINHHKISLNNSFVLKKGYVKALIGFQQNQRKEFADLFDPNIYELYFLMNTLNYDLRYVYSENHLDVSAGINGMQQHSKNRGEEFLIPEYNLFDIGGFITAKKTLKKISLSGGIRFDQRTQKSNELLLDAAGKPTETKDSTTIEKFEQFNKQFSGISGSIGMTYDISENLYTKVNIARGYRSPNIAELGSNGVHEGTLRYEKGNTNLKPEFSLQFDYSFGINTEHLTLELNLFQNSISNYIFLEKLLAKNGNDSITEDHQTFRFKQGKATLLGGEIVFDIHPHPFDWLHIENTFSFVETKQLNVADSMKYLPMIPAPKIISEIRTDITKAGKFFSNLYFKFQVENYFDQHHVYSAYHTETVTAGYTLLNAGFGGNIKTKKDRTICSLFVSVNNITDNGYQNHLSRLKYAPENFANGRRGVYNMGRNIGIKIIFSAGWTNS